MEKLDFYHEGPKLQINRNILTTLCRNVEKSAAELAIYLYITSNGEKTELLGREFLYVPCDVQTLCQFTGYGKSRVYYALNNLFSWKVIFFNKIKNKKVIIVSGTIDASKAAKDLKFHSSGKKGENSTPVEKQADFPPQWKNSTPVESANTNRKRSNSSDDTQLELLAVDRLEFYETIRGNTILHDISITEYYMILHDISNVSTRNVSTRMISYNINNVISRNVSIRILRNIRNITYKGNYQIFDEKLTDAILDLLKTFKRPDKKSKPKGYYSSQYAPGGSRHHYSPKSENQKIFRFYMKNLFQRHNIDYYIPKSRMPKYFARIKSTADLLGGYDKVKSYIKWYLGKNQFASSGYNLDLMLSTPVTNQYLAANPRDKGTGLSKEIITDDKDRKDMQGTIL